MTRPVGGAPWLRSLAPWVALVSLGVGERLARAAPPATTTATTVLGGALAPTLDPRLAAGADWPAGRVDTQLDGDGTLIPFGKGAIFVPAITSGFDEPPVEVLKNEERVAEGKSGQRIILSPGTYIVRIGSGASQQRMRVQATVRELSTTVIPVSWSALTIHVVDERYNSLRSSYELIRVSDREYMGIGFGTDEQAGEPVSTWVLRPGVYKIVRVGENYRARRDFVTVRLVERNHTHFLLVLDPDTGEFAGGGEVPEKELFRAQDGFFRSLVVGGDVTMNIRNNAVGQVDGASVSARGFLDGKLSVQILQNPLILRLQVEEGLTNPPQGQIQKTIDRVDLDALYLYRVQPWIGPYVRVEAETNIFPNEENFPQTTNNESYTVVRLRADETELRRNTVQDSGRLSPGFGLTRVREGVGLNIRAIKTVSAEVNIRAGFGARHAITNDFFDIDPRSPDLDGNCPGDNECQEFRTRFPGLEPDRTRIYRQVLGNDQVGAETALIATVRITRFVLVNGELDALLTAPIENTIIDAEGSVALKLTSYMSINYVIRYTRDVNIAVGDPNNVEQDILLRFSVDLL